jgi:hypothetical protein
MIFNNQEILQISAQPISGVWIESTEIYDQYDGNMLMLMQDGMKNKECIKYPDSV